MAIAPGSPDEWQTIICRFIQDHVRRSRASGVVIGVSGGIDSSLTAALAVRALGADKVTAVLMPHALSHTSDLEAGKHLCTHLGLDPQIRNITAAADGLLSVVHDTGGLLGNIKARLRMTVLYAEAQSRGALVLGTGNKSELLIGYFTKHGDGGVDLEPIGDLYKTQVWELARHLDLPAPLVDRVPSAGLIAGQTDEEDLGMPYVELDAILKGMELNASLDSIANRTGLPLAQVEKVEAMVRGSEHKRHAPLVPKLGARTVGIDWRRSVHWDA